MLAPRYFLTPLIAAFIQAHRVPLLQELFGDQPSAVLYTLVACAVAVPLLLGGAGLGHILLVSTIVMHTMAVG